MVLSDQDKKLLTDIFTVSLSSQEGINLSRFRADNEDFIPNLDKLEREGYLQRTNNNMYFISLLTLLHLSKENPDAQSLLQNCGVIFTTLKRCYRDNLGKMVPVSEIAQKTALSEKDVSMALKFMVQTPIGLGYSTNAANIIESASPSEGILRYKSFKEVVSQQEEWEKQRDSQINEPKKPAHRRLEYSIEQKAALSVTSSKINWEAIEKQFGISKIGFGMKINFVADPFKRTILFRDVEDAFALASAGYSKPAVILAGGVIEELLRLYLDQRGISPQKPLKRDFNGYIQTCIQNKLLKDSVSHLSDSVRGFRNLVHLSAEETKKHTISKAAAIGAVSSIFTIANDF